jgi:hypothetical protein
VVPVVYPDLLDKLLLQVVLVLIEQVDHTLLCKEAHHAPNVPQENLLKQLLGLIQLELIA